MKPPKPRMGGWGVFFATLLGLFALTLLFLLLSTATSDAPFTYPSR